MNAYNIKSEIIYFKYNTNMQKELSDPCFDSLDYVLSAINQLDLSMDNESDIPSEGELCNGFDLAENKWQTMEKIESSNIKK